jgi:single-strand DNA-binding protein
MPSVNSCHFVGRAGKDAEMGYTQGGTAITRFSLAVDHNFKDADGNWKNDTEWVRFVVFGDAAERAAEQVRKGKLFYAEGRMQTRSWADKNTGDKHYTTEIVANRVVPLDKREQSEQAPEERGEPVSEELDELPF